MSRARDLEFIFEIGSMRNIQRTWRQQLGVDCESNPEHAFRVAFIALTIARGEGVNNDEKILKMALIHGIGEARCGDLNYIGKVYVKQDEARAAHDTLAQTSLSDLEAFLIEYEKRESIEAKIVKDADNLDVDFELKELEERGHQLPRKWQDTTRRLVRDEKLYTKTAKSIWDDLRDADPSSWHLTSNKWYKIPSAGK